MNRGRLIALEGLDGCGKTTQAARIAEALGRAGGDVALTREPTDGPAGQRIRALARAGQSIAVELELQLFLDDRREHVANVIEPALAAGRWVVTDRYFLSTVAYQGARGFDWRELLARCEAEFPLPDAALLFEISVEQGLARARSRGASDPHFEQAAYLAQVGAIFAALERPYLARVDASGSADAVSARALAALRARFDIG